jgi:hypothetical protein
MNFVLQNATQMLEELERAFDSVKRQLFERLHDKLRDQLFPVMPHGYNQQYGESNMSDDSGEDDSNRGESLNGSSPTLNSRTGS